MKYYLKINDTEFSTCSALEVTCESRSESVKTTLSGKYLIDRIGGTKLNVSAKVNMLSESEMSVLRSAYQSIKANVTFYYGAGLVTKSMRIKAFDEPSPLPYYGNRANGYVYGSVELEMEEM